jgi:arsenate reductase (thioredoxin)
VITLAHYHDTEKNSSEVTMEKEKVLFLCTGNSCRSQMAEAFLRQIAGDRFEVFSAGLEPTEIHPLTYEVMAEVGLDLAGQRSKSVGEFLGKVMFQYLITVCDDADKNCPTVWPGVVSRMHWSFEDPAKFTGTLADKLEKFREVRDQIQQRILDWAG